MKHDMMIMGLIIGHTHIRGQDDDFY